MTAERRLARHRPRTAAAEQSAASTAGAPSRLFWERFREDKAALLGAAS